jgi:hypothetical protein
MIDADLGSCTHIEKVTFAATRREALMTEKSSKFIAVCGGLWEAQDSKTQGAVPGLVKQKI